MQSTQADVTNPDECAAHIEDTSSSIYDLHLQQEPSKGLLQPSEMYLPSASGDVKMDVQDDISSDADDLEDYINLGTRDTLMFCLLCLFFF
jgi:hypothetical protein